jgi:hypothetical protein
LVRIASFIVRTQAVGTPVGIAAVVVAGDHLALERIVEGTGLGRVLPLRVAAVGGDAPAVGVGGVGGPPLDPPAVEDREVGGAVGRRFMPEVPLASSGARGLLSQTSTPA